MALIPCPDCGRQISTEAEACPQCGRPNRPAAPAAPKCYACPAAATTRCVSCGALSCALHLDSIYVPHGRGGAYELRCRSCFDSAATWKVVGFVVFFVFLIVVLAVFASVSR